MVSIWFLLLLLAPRALARDAPVLVGNAASLLTALRNQTVNTVAIVGNVTLLDSAPLVLPINRYSRACSTDLRGENAAAGQHVASKQYADLEHATYQANIS